MVSNFEKRARKVRRAVRRVPALKPVVDRVGARVWRRHLRRAARHDAVDAGRLLWIDPADIRLSMPAEVRAEVLAGPTRELVGREAGGDWDTRLEPIEARPFVGGAVERYAHGTAWDDTRFADEIRTKLRTEGPQHRYREEADIARLGARWDELAEAIRRDGLVPQDQLPDGKPWDEVLVAFDRAGRAVFVEGVHRLAIARALGLERIPVRAALRHADLVRFTGELRAYVTENQRGRSYQPLLHPDLADIPSSHGTERFDLIADALPVRQGRLLDIGANWGYFCHRFEALGFAPVAAERSAKELYFLEALRDASGCTFEIWPGSITDQPDLTGFEVVLALNVFHHFLKEEANYRELLALLGRLDTSYLVFEPHLPTERQMQQAYRNLEPDAFVALVSEHSGLGEVRLLGTVDSGRPVYLLSKAGS